MINVSINDNGEINISQETPGERIYMGEHYARMEREEAAASRQTSDDEDRAHWFKEGWNSAIRESQLQYTAGRIEDFWNEMGVSEDPHHNEPEGTGEETDVWPPRELTDDELIAQGHYSEEEIYGVGGKSNQPLVRPVADSGEPEKETDETAFRGLDGVWTISDDELQNRLDTEFQRGLAYVSPTVPRRVSDQELAAIREEGYGQGVADSGAAKQEPRTIKFSALRGIADRVASQPRPDGENANLDDLLREVAVELGYEVTR